MPFKNAADWISDEPLRFPVGDAVYEVVPFDLRPWTEYVDWASIANGDTELPKLKEEAAVVLGPDVASRMADDGVPAAIVRRAILAVITESKLGRETAERVWESGLSPEALAPSMGATQTTTQPPSTESENETPSPASTRTTTSRKGSSKKRAAKGSHSQTSSSSGA